MAKSELKVTIEMNISCNMPVLAPESELPVDAELVELLLDMVRVFGWKRRGGER